MLKFAATIAVAGMIFFVADMPQAQAQVVTTYYAPAPSVGVVPVRRGLFGLRTGYAPVVINPAPIPVTTMYAPAPVTTYYAPAAPVTSYYAPAPVTTYYAPAAPVTPYTTYYAPAPLPVTTYYAPPVIYRR